MSLRISGHIEPPALPTVDLNEEISYGDPIKWTLQNEGKSSIFKTTIEPDNEGKYNVQLARDEDDSPGVWAAAGESIEAFSGVCRPGETISFWARGIFSHDDVEGARKLELVIENVRG